MNKKVKYNAIPKQEKSPTSKITATEWNHIINVLKEQTNYSSEILEEIIKDLGYTKEDFNKKIEMIEEGLYDWDSIIREIKNHKEIHIGSEEPKGFETIWFDTSNKN